MSFVRPSWQAVLGILLCLAAMALPAMSSLELDARADPTATIDYPFLGTAG
ncbi:MAG: ABC transporter permease, partial [Hyphomicrobiales bacterium]|nr:ABC transporter permease [Hyphomicrobiales bacterium]